MQPKLFAAILPMVTILAACGGGGGGGGGSTTLQPTAEITDANALTITREVLSWSELFSDDDFPGFNTTASSDVEPGATLTAATFLPPIFNNLSNARATFAAASVANPLVIDSCDAGGTVDIVYPSPTRVRFTFNNCNGFAELELSGLINGVMDLTDNDPNGNYVLDGTLNFDDFEIEEDSSVLMINGDFRIRTRDLTDGSEYLHERNDSFVTRFELSVDQETSVLIDYDSSLVLLYSPSEDIEQDDFRGSLDGGAFEGVVNFDTPVPIVVDRNLNDLFTQGQLLIEGANDSSIVVEFIPESETVDVQIDVDGDGVTDFTPAWMLSDLSDLY